MDRRGFVEQVAAWSAGALLAAPVFNVQSIMAADEQDAKKESGKDEKNQKKESPLVAVAKGKDYKELVDKVVKTLGGIEKFVKKGDRVVVKPNIGWDRKPEQAANTHPDVVVAIIKLCLDAGAKQVSVFDRTCNDARRSYASSGIQAAVNGMKEARVKCFFVNDKNLVPVTIENAASIHKFTFYKEAMATECDCYINVPIAKNHTLAKLTLGLKNVMGVIGGNRGDIHLDIGPRIADLNLVIRPKLTIIDATRILLRHGPTGGNLNDVKVLDTLIASTDPVAADAYATTLFDLKPEDISSTVAAAKLGLGEIDLSKVKVVTA
jgi:uncharacterized protein (DUF362 family)